MKTILYFIVTCFISTLALLGAMGLKNPFPNFGVAFGIWLLFFWGYHRRAKKAAEREYRERQFQQYLDWLLRERMR